MACLAHKPLSTDSIGRNQKTIIDGQKLVRKYHLCLTYPVFDIEVIRGMPLFDNAMCILKRKGNCKEPIKKYGLRHWIGSGN